MKKTIYNITFQMLWRLFPKDTMWTTSGAELIGYSPKTNRHIVIDDGLCISDDGYYLVHEYSPKNPKEHLLNWNNGIYPLKYVLKSPKIREERVNFNL